MSSQMRVETNIMFLFRRNNETETKVVWAEFTESLLYVLQNNFKINFWIYV